MCDKCNAYRFYTWTRQLINAPQEIPIKAYTNGIIVTNVGAPGNALIRVNGYPINAPLVVGMNGESWTIGGGPGDVITDTTLEILFENSAIGACFIQQKYYVSQKV